LAPSLNHYNVHVAREVATEDDRERINNMRRYPRIPAALVLVGACLIGWAYVRVWGHGRGSDRAKWSLQELEVAIANGDADAQTWYLLGSRLQGARRYNHAAAAYRKSLDADPSLRDARLGCASALALAGGEEEFYNFMRDMITIDPKMADDFFERAECRPYLAKARFDELRKEAHIQAMD
jgi:cytochrome c-type biogenesis protein CcmH/NrfG